MSENRVVIYSNGIADFQRCYEVDAATPERISIPVRQDHLADVLASFNVYGNVKLESPPTFRPSNELEGNISIDPQRVLEDLATNLSGAKVRVDRAEGTVEGTLVGLHQEEEATTGEPIHPKSVIILSSEGLRRCVLREIQSLKFLDQDVQSEIDKALQRNYQRIKPNSTFVELVLSSAGDKTEAVVQYTIPAAAWKISYRLRMTEGSATELQGYAIVDNNTDEDWDGFRVCVVTGEPITFSTDLADSKSPNRKHVNLVSDAALGAVEVAAKLAYGGMDPIEQVVDGMRADDDLDETRFAMSRRSRKSLAAAPAATMMMSAETASAEIQEVGDFNIFESDSPVSIPAKRSTVIPVFNVAIDDTKRVLHYKHENHPERPYRSIDFTNSAGFSLGRGVCTVFEEAAYAGNCIMPALKHGEQRLLPHALETGVSVHRDQKRQRNKVVALRLADGFCYTRTRQRRETHYRVKNSRDEQLELVLDHDFTLVEPDIKAVLSIDGTEHRLEAADKLAFGTRYSIAVAAKSEFALKVVEQRVAQTKVELVVISKQDEDLHIDWLHQNLVKTNGPLAEDPGIQESLRIHHDLEAKQEEIVQANNETARITARQKRLRENIKAGGQGELTNRWRGELDEAEQAIKKIEEEQLPALRQDEKKLRAKLRAALKSLSAEWVEASK